MNRVDHLLLVGLHKLAEKIRAGGPAAGHVALDSDAVHASLHEGLIVSAHRLRKAPHKVAIKFLLLVRGDVEIFHADQIRGKIKNAGKTPRRQNAALTKDFFPKGNRFAQLMAILVSQRRRHFKKNFDLGAVIQQMFRGHERTARRTRAGIRPGFLFDERALGRNDFKPAVLKTIADGLRTAQFPTRTAAAKPMRRFQATVLGHEVEIKFVGQFRRVNHPVHGLFVRVIKREVFFLDERRDRHAIRDAAAQSDEQSFSRGHGAYFSWLIVIGSSFGSNRWMNSKATE